jgi:SAM-dependent methyltransferase
MKSPYGPIATEFYQITKPLDAFYPDLEFYREHLQSKKEKILEIGSGTGRFLLPLLRDGCQIEGIENNPFMIEQCLKNAKAHKIPQPKILKKDLLEWKPEQESYDVILFTFGTLQLFSKWDDLTRMLMSARRALRPKGRIYIDIDVTRVDISRSGIRTMGTKVTSDDGSDIYLEGSKTYDFVNQIESHEIRYEKWKAGKIVGVERQTIEIRWFGVQELRMLLNESGFRNIRHCFDYDVENVDADPSADVICYSATK